MASLGPPEARSQISLGITELSLVEVLYEAEEPIIYVALGPPGLRLLVYLAEAQDSGEWLLVAPIGDSQLKSLKAGFTPVRTALFESWCLQCYRARDGELRFWSISESDVPAEFLPVSDTPLYPRHTPVLVIKAIGQDLFPGRLTSSIVSSMAESGRKALKNLIDFVIDEGQDGRPASSYRAMYDLPVQRLRFGSFEVAFGAPQCDEDSLQNSNRAACILASGLQWLAGEDNSEPVPGADDEERLAILDSLIELTPAQGSRIDRIELSGAWLGSRIISLNKQSRSRVRKEISFLRAERVIRVIGRVREMDQDRLSFTLRETDQHGPMKIFFAEEMFDEVLKSFSDATKVEVVVAARLSRYLLRAIAELPEGSEDEHAMV